MKKRFNFLPIGVVLGFIAFFSSWLMWSTFDTTPGFLRIDSKLFSDFGAHLPLIRSFSLGSNIPPAYPTFPGLPIRYHFLFYMVVGYLERVGVPLGFALNILSALGFGLLLWMIYKIGFLYSKRHLAGILAVSLLPQQADHDLAIGERGVVVGNLAQARRLAGRRGDELIDLGECVHRRRKCQPDDFRHG